MLAVCYIDRPDAEIMIGVGVSCYERHQQRERRQAVREQTSSIKRSDALSRRENYAIWQEMDTDE